MPFNEERVSWPRSGHQCCQSACQTTVKYYGSIFGEPNRLAPTLTAVASQLWRHTRLATLAEANPLRAPLRSALANQRSLCVSSRPLLAQQRGGIFVVVARSGSPRSPTLACSGRSSIESSRPVRARRFAFCRGVCIAFPPLSLCVPPRA